MTAPILVTGAGRRVGLHLAETLLEHDYQPLVHYHNRTDSVGELSDRGVPVIQGDFDHREGIFEFLDTVRDTVDSLGGIIHNASMFADTDPDLQTAASQFNDFFHVHMMAPFVLTEGLMELLEKSSRDPTDVIALTDMYADRPEPDVDAYCATKAGLASLVSSGAQKYAPEVKMNAVAPGPVLFEEGADEDYRRRVLEKTPMNREGGENSISEVVLMILEHDFMNGATVPVDGGRRLTD